MEWGFTIVVTLVVFVLGLTFGALCVYVRLKNSLESIRRAKAVADIRLEEMDKKIQERERMLEQAESHLVTTFQALSGEALKSNNRAFLDLAKKELEGLISEAEGVLGKREEAIKSVIKPLEEALKRYESQIYELEKSRASAYGSLESQIKNLVMTQQRLEKETNNLVTALRRPEVRGRWGELALRRVVELAGMSEYCDYTEQVQVDTDEGRLRPDMIVHLPGEREVVVDSKVSLDAYLDAVRADSQEQRRGLYIKHAQQTRKHMRLLSAKSYWDQFPKAPEFVIMFMPGESFLSAALEYDHTLLEDGMQQRVIIATPTTLIALLRAIAYGWRQEQITKNAKRIADLGKEVYDRFQPFLEHVNKTGSHLSQTVLAFNKMVTSLERRVMVSMKKFKELGASGDKELPEPQTVEQIPARSQEIDSPQEDI